MINEFQKAETVFIPSQRLPETMNLENFIKENFQIPNNDLERILDFVKSDIGLEKIIFELPRLIKSKLSYDKLQIKFYDEFQNDYLQLEVSIFSSIDVSTSLKLEEMLEHQLYELYDCNSADKILIILE